MDDFEDPNEQIQTSFFNNKFQKDYKDAPKKSGFKAKLLTKRKKMEDESEEVPAEQVVE